jgi:hypothetical protein
MHYDAHGGRKIMAGVVTEVALRGGGEIPTFYQLCSKGLAGKGKGMDASADRSRQDFDGWSSQAVVVLTAPESMKGVTP